MLLRLGPFTRDHERCTQLHAISSIFRTAIAGLQYEGRFFFFQSEGARVKEAFYAFIT